MRALTRWLTDAQRRWGLGLSGSSSTFLRSDGTEVAPSLPAGSVAPLDVHYYYPDQASPHTCTDEFAAGSLDGKWTQVNSPTITFPGDGSLLLALGGTDAKRAISQPYTSLATNPPDGSHPLTIDVAVSHNQASASGAQAGIYISDGTKLYVIGVTGGANVFAAHYSGTGAGTFVGSDLAATAAFALGQPCWIRVVDNGTTIQVFTSSNGFCWRGYPSWGRAGYLTPSEFGLVGNGVGVAIDAAFHFFRVTQP